MEQAFLSTYLEELVYESDEGCFVQDIFHRVVTRGFWCDDILKTSLWPKIRNHPDVLFISCSSTYDNVSLIDFDSVPENWCPPSTSTTWLFDSFKIVASLSLRRSVLDVWERPELSDTPLRLRILSAIASRRYEGLWQVDLTSKLNIDSKTLFQNLKAFYKYDCIVRYQLPLLNRINRTKNMSGSGVLWLKRFFDVQRIPSDMLQILYSQQIAPIGKKLVALLQTVPDNIALEADLKAFCLSFFMKQGQSSLFCSLRNATRYFTKLRQDLISTQQLARVKAWCPQSGKFENCLALYAAAQRLLENNQHRPLTSSNHNLKDLQSSSIIDHCQSVDLYQTNPIHLTYQTHYTTSPHQDMINPTYTQSEEIKPNINVVKNNSIIVSVQESNEQSDCLNCTNDSQSSKSHLINSLTDTEPIHNVHVLNNTLQDDIQTESFQTQDNKEMKECDDDSLSNGYTLYELPLLHQILCFINASYPNGILTTQIGTLTGITTKRLMRLLQNLESLKWINRRGQRIGKHFVYRYFSGSSSYTHPPTQTNPVIEQDLPPSSTEFNNTSESITHLKQEITNEMIEDIPTIITSSVQLNKSKTNTEQFASRLTQVIQAIETFGACVAPQLSKIIAQKENTRGPDRRTVLRLVEHAMNDHPHIRKTTLLKGRVESQPVSIFYWTQKLTESEAQSFIERSISEKRSESCKDAIKRNLKFLEQLNSTLSTPAMTHETTQNDSTTPDTVHQTVISTDKDAALVLSDPFPFINQDNIKKKIELKNFTNRIERWMTNNNPIELFNSNSKNYFLPNVHVQSRADHRRIRQGWGGAPYSQVVLAHYGFLFPVMIRLKVFHRHLLDCLSFIKQVNEPNDTSCSLKQQQQNYLTSFQIINLMPLDIYFQTIGSGYRLPSLELFLRENDNHLASPIIQDLPDSIRDSLLYPHTRRTSSFKQHHLIPNASPAKIAADRLLEKLVILKCVRPVPILSNNEERLHHPPLNTQTIEWEPFRTVDLEKFYSEKELIGRNKKKLTSKLTLIGRFDVLNLIEFESYWRALKSEIDRWCECVTIHSENMNVSVTQQYSQQASHHNTGPLQTHITDALGQDSDKDIRHSNSLDINYMYQRNSVFHCSRRKQRRLSYTLLKTNSTEQDHLNDLQSVPLKKNKQSMLLPMNLQLNAAFSKKNWKGQILLSPRVRAELDKFALKLLNTFYRPERMTQLQHTRRLGQHGPPTCIELLNEKNETTDAQTAAALVVIEAAADINHKQQSCLSLNDELMDNHCKKKAHAKGILPQVVNPRTPEIEELALTLKIPTDAVIRYLLRYFQTTKHSYTSLCKEVPFVIHTTRDLRYRCHLCGIMYATFPAISQHYQSIHNDELPNDPFLYLLPHEYKKRIAKNPLKMTKSQQEVQDDTGDHILSMRDALLEQSEVSTGEHTVQEMKESVISRQLINNMKREEHLLLLGIAVIAERLLLSTCSTNHCSVSSTTDDNTHIQQLSESVFKSNQYSLSIFSNNGHLFPNMLHPIWKLMGQLLPQSMYQTPAQIRQSLYLLLKEIHSSLHMRVFRTYRRLSGTALSFCLHRGDIAYSPSQIGKHIVSIDPVMDTLLSSPYDDRKDRVLLWRNNLKVILLSPILTYRPYWAFELAKELRETEIQFIWNDWRKKGWVTQYKPISRDVNQLSFQGLMDSKCIRKYCLSKVARFNLFGKARDYYLINNIHTEYNKLYLTPFRVVKTPNLDANVLDDNDITDMTGYNRTTQSSKFQDIVEPVNGAYVAAILEETIRGGIQIQTLWEGDSDFYDRHDKDTDNKLLHLLLKNTTMDSDSDASSSCSLTPSKISHTLSPITCLDDEKIQSDFHNQQDNNNVHQASCVLEPEEKKNQTDLIHFAQENHRCYPNSENKVSLHLSNEHNGVQQAQQQLKESTVPLYSHQYLDTVSDCTLETDNRVMARAIEGGVEKHISELTGDISDVGTLRYKLNQYPELSSVSDQLMTASLFDVHSITDNIDHIIHTCFKHHPCASFILNDQSSHIQTNTSLSPLTMQSTHYKTASSLPFCKSQSSFKLYHHNYRILQQMGCLYENDSPDPQLFSNFFFFMGTESNPFCLSDKALHTQFKLPWVMPSDVDLSTEHTHECISVLPFYDDDASHHWSWLMEPFQLVDFEELSSSLSFQHQSLYSLPINLSDNSCVLFLQHHLFACYSVWFNQYEQIGTIQTQMGHLPREDPIVPIDDHHTIPVSHTNDPSTQCKYAWILQHCNKDHFIIQMFKCCWYFIESTSSLIGTNSTIPIILKLLSHCIRHTKYLIKDDPPIEPDVYLPYKTVNEFWMLCGVLTELLLKQEIPIHDPLYSWTTEQPSHDLNQMIIQKHSAIKALIHILIHIHQSGVIGVSEYQVQQQFQLFWDNEVRQWPMNHDTQSVVSDIKSPFIKTQTKDKSLLFQRVVWILESTRLIIRIPAMKYWQFISSEYAESYCIVKRSIQYLIPIKTTPSSGVLQYDSSLSTFHHCHQSYLIHSGGSFYSHEYIPKRLWGVWGPYADIHWSLLFSDPSQQCPTHSTKSLLHTFNLQCLLILIIRMTITSIVSLLAKQMTQQIDQTHDTQYITPLPWNLTPCCGWIQLDGHLNATCIHLMNSRLIQMIQDTPGIFKDHVYQTVPILDWCETEYLLDCLSEENVILLVPHSSGRSLCYKEFLS